MFNYGAIDKTPTINQIKAIIKYLEESPNIKCDFNNMMEMNRIKPNIITIDLNNAHYGDTYEVTFNESNEITSFKKTGQWMS